MKINKPKTGLTTNQEKDDSSLDFGIGDTGVIIDILRRRLYSHPLRTMIQEYLSNGRDASRENKSSRPLEVTCPTVLDPVFKVRDFGPGLSPQRTKEVFVLYGASTKRKDNTQTGGFGIGAKSAWAYTDSFMVTSFYEGKKYTYIAHLGHNTEGSLDLMEAEETKEPSGVEISVSIKSDDINQAIESIFRSTLFWNPRPMLKGLTEVEIPEHYQKLPLIQGPGFYADHLALPCLRDIKNHERAMLKKISKSATFNVFALVDGIPYDVTKFLKEELKNNYAPSSQFYLLFKTGELQINANREEIVFDEASIKTIEDRMRLIYQDLGKTLAEGLKDCKSLEELKDRIESGGSMTLFSGEFEVLVDIQDQDIMIKKKKEGVFFEIIGVRIFDLKMTHRIRSWRYQDLRPLLVVDEEWVSSWEEFLHRGRVVDILPFMSDMWVIKAPVPEIYKPYLAPEIKQERVRAYFNKFIELREKEETAKQEEQARLLALRKEKRERELKWGLEGVASFNGGMVQIDTIKVVEVPKKDNWVYYNMVSGISSLVDPNSDLARQMLYASLKLKKRVLLTDPQRLYDTVLLELPELGEVVPADSFKLKEKEREKILEFLIGEISPGFLSAFSFDFLESLRIYTTSEEFEVLRAMKIISLDPPEIDLDEYNTFYAEDIKEIKVEVEEIRKALESWLERNYFFRIINYQSRFWEREALKLVRDLAPEEIEEKGEGLLKGLAGLIRLRKKD